MILNIDVFLNINAMPISMLISASMGGSCNKLIFVTVQRSDDTFPSLNIRLLKYETYVFMKNIRIHVPITNSVFEIKYFFLFIAEESVFLTLPAEKSTVMAIAAIRMKI